MTADSLFENIVDITEQYLGPAARRFIVRQVAFHLSKAPRSSTPKTFPS